MPCQFCPHCIELAQKKSNPNYLAVQELWDYGLSLGFTSVKQNLNRFAISRLLKKYDKEQIKKLCTYAQKIKAEGAQYAPRIYNFMDLEEKLARLLDYQARNGASDIASKPNTERGIIGYKQLPDKSMQPIYGGVA